MTQAMWPQGRGALEAIERAAPGMYEQQAPQQVPAGFAPQMARYRAEHPDVPAYHVYENYIVPQYEQQGAPIPTYREWSSTIRDPRDVEAIQRTYESMQQGAAEPEGYSRAMAGAFDSEGLIPAASPFDYLVGTGGLIRGAAGVVGRAAGAAGRGIGRAFARGAGREGAEAAPAAVAGRLRTPALSTYRPTRPVPSAEMAPAERYIMAGEGPVPYARPSQIPTEGPQTWRWGEPRPAEVRMPRAMYRRAAMPPPQQPAAPYAAPHFPRPRMGERGASLLPTAIPEAARAVGGAAWDIGRGLIGRGPLGPRAGALWTTAAIGAPAFSAAYHGLFGAEPETGAQMPEAEDPAQAGWMNYLEQDERWVDGSQLGPGFEGLSVIQGDEGETWLMDFSGEQPVVVDYLAPAGVQQ